jgi:hypothetical protein
LAFEQGGPDLATGERFSIVIGSLSSGLLDCLILRFSSKPDKAVD